MTARRSASRRRFDQLVALFAARLDNRNTRRAYESDLDRFADWCDAQRIDPLRVGPRHIDRFRDASEAATHRPATVSRRLAVLSSFYGFAVEQGALRRSPTGATQRPASHPSNTAQLTAEQITRLLDASDDIGPRVALLVSLLVRDGLKLSEVLSADADDLRDRSTTLAVRRAGRSTRIDLSRATTRAASAYLRGRRDGPLLLSDSRTRHDRRLTRFGADFLLKRAARAAGITESVSANQLRRSHVIAAHAAGETIETIRDRLGHRDVRTTRRHLLADGEGSPRAHV